MCGIAGIVKTKNHRVTLEEIQGMTNIIEHRGPDGEGHFIDKNVGLGHRRLAIIDLSKAGHQPMEQGDLIIVYNGEIYNYLEIRNELESQGIIFNTRTDTEVILNAYRVWGEACVHRFNGMWSFAIFEKSKNRIFISRDRFGIKPFYYFKTEDQFVFGSEIKQLLPYVKDRKVNKQVLYDFIYLTYLHHNENTFFEGIKSLLPGHNMIFDVSSGTYSIEKYYELKQTKELSKLDQEAAVQQYKKAFKDAIDLRLRSDVKVGTCLSGGLDSSYVAKVASESYKGKDLFNAITAKSIDATNDESHFAQEAAETYGLKWNTVAPSKEDFYKNLENIVYNQEEPFGSPSIFMQYFVMKKAKEEGCIVMLDGQGGDETLLGYERYFIAYLKTFKNPIRFLKQFLKLSGNSKLSISKLFLYYIYFGFSKVRRKRILRKNAYILSKNHKYFDKNLAGEFEKASRDIFALQKKEICELQLPKLLKFEDRSSMAHSIEARVPFIDYKLVELAVSLSPEHKIHDGWSKFLLRKSYGGDAPENIVWRKNKLGFEAPTKKWMADKTIFIQTIKNSDFMENIIDKEYAYEKLDVDTLWKLYNISKWAEMFKITY